jgi:hypothetical protein
MSGRQQPPEAKGYLGETEGGQWWGEPFEGGFVTYCAFVSPNIAHLD